ncbi:MAG: hypothetical protein ACQEP1_00485 [Nanobdellota archaeon]
MIAIFTGNGLRDYFDLWRISNDESEVEIISFILDIMDHKRYDKKLGYR